MIELHKINGKLNVCCTICGAVVDDIKTSLNDGHRIETSKVVCKGCQKQYNVLLDMKIERGVC